MTLPAEQTNELIQLVVAVISTVATIVLLQLKTYLANKTESETLRVAEDKVISFLITRIKRQQEDVVKGLRADFADGKITKEELGARLRAIGESTVADVKTAVGEKVTSILGKHYGSVSEFLADKRDSILGDIKKQ